MKEEKFEISMEGKKAIPKTKKGKRVRALKNIPLVLFTTFLSLFILVFTPILLIQLALSSFTSINTDILEYILKIIASPMFFILLSTLPSFIISIIGFNLENDKDFDYRYTRINPHEVVGIMNKIIQLENGKLLPKYKFIDWEKSKTDMIVLSIPLDSNNQPLKQIHNEHVKKS